MAFAIVEITRLSFNNAICIECANGKTHVIHHKLSFSTHFENSTNNQQKFRAIMFHKRAIYNSGPNN